MITKNQGRFALTRRPDGEEDDLSWVDDTWGSEAIISSGALFLHSNSALSFTRIYTILMCRLGEVGSISVCFGTIFASLLTKSGVDKVLTGNSG